MALESSGRLIYASAMPPPLSVAIICRNEARHIGDALASVAFADEIIVVDSGSTDGTVQIARAAGARVILRPWEGHIRQKNFAADQCAGPWILGIDADERVTSELRASIQREMENPRYEAYRVARLCWFMGRWIRHGGWYPDAKVRLWKQGAGRWGGYDPHDDVKVAGPVGRLDGDLQHYVYRDVQHNLETIARYSSILARELHERGRRAHLWDLVLRPPLVFFKKLILRHSFLDGIPGLVIATTSAFSVYAKYAKLWERQRGRNA